ncbi:MAG: hypothetical protein M5U34_43090 [Chloroflexi bacterium]|nr:hypothetical protein [Chloroflexota bacterium]
MEAGLTPAPSSPATPPLSTMTIPLPSLHDRLAHLGAGLLRERLDDILTGRLTAHAQDNALSTYAPMISKEDGRLDWTKSAAELDRQICAMTPWPGAFTTWQGQPLKILSAKPRAHSRSVPPGFVVYDMEAKETVATGSGSLVFRNYSTGRQKAMSATDLRRLP